MIKVVKLLTGEELVGDVIETEAGYCIKKPCALQFVPSRSNPDQPMMALFPYGVYTEDHTVNVCKSHVVWVEKPIKELYNQYNSAFGSGLVVPS